MKLVGNGVNFVLKRFPGPWDWDDSCLRQSLAYLSFWYPPSPRQLHDSCPFDELKLHLPLDRNMQPLVRSVGFGTCLEFRFSQNSSLYSSLDSTRYMPKRAVDVSCAQIKQACDVCRPCIVSSD